MKLMQALVFAVVAVFGLLSTVSAQQQQSSRSGPTPAEASDPYKPLSPKERDAIAHDLIVKWQNDVRKRPGGNVPRWSSKLKAAVAEADDANLLRASTLTSLELMHAALAGEALNAALQSSRAIGNDSVAPQYLGSTTADTTYTPLANGRCRVADSRVINSPIPAGATRNLEVESVANYTAQGGTGTYSNGTGSANCGIPSYATAYVISVTLLSPAASGVFKVFPSNTAAQTGNSILFNAGDYGANGDQIIRSCRYCSSEISIQSSARIHYVIDVIGYFHAPQATMLECMTTSTREVSMGPGATSDLDAPYCATGYVEVGTLCRANTWSMNFVQQLNGRCSGWNNSSGNAIMYASRRCCRIPGR
jgi:hypothetical protein